MKKKKTRSKKPVFSTEDGYKRMQEIRFCLPYQFLQLCKLTKVTPRTMLSNFMESLGREAWKRHPDDKMRTCTADYFILQGYGQDYYSETDIRKMLGELDAISSLWPENSSSEMIETHARWRDRYHKYWFRKWYYKVRRQDKASKKTEG